jgi:hypothetical protein
MYRKYLTARSPLRLLEKGLHGGLGKGNLGLLLAGRGVGKTACLVGIALDELLRGGHVLHVALDHPVNPVNHVREFYDTVFHDLAETTHLEDAARVHAECDRRRSIRAYRAASFSAAKLRESVKFETEAGAKPELVILEGFDVASAPRDELLDLRVLAGELDAEIWLSASVPEERVRELPASLQPLADVLSVILALDPGDGALRLRALKDHDSPDVSALHVSLDPTTLLLKRS